MVKIVDFENAYKEIKRFGMMERIAAASREAAKKAKKMKRAVYCGR